MDARKKLAILSEDAKYDLSCACGCKDDDRRKRGPGGMWIYPVSVPRGGRSIIMKSLLSNACQNNCRYCPLRLGQDIPRYTLEPEEMARLFMDYQRYQKLHGLFLTSGVNRNPDATMQQIVDTARLLRKRYAYRGFLHLKIIPGASDAAIEAALGLASAVSLNVEAPNRSSFQNLTTSKDFDRDIVGPIQHISRLTASGGRYSHVKQTTQFIVGAANEHDRDILTATFGLYRRLHLNRVYFSAYQQQTDEHENIISDNLLTREHRLYQAEFLLRKYRWPLEDIAFEADGNLSLGTDPKLRWAQQHPEYFPVRLRSASRESLLRVPGLGPITAGRIMAARRNGGLRSLGDAGVVGKRLAKAWPYVVMN